MCEYCYHVIQKLTRTILGQILFIIYANDLPDLCIHFHEILLSADDATLYKRVTCEDDRVSLQVGLDVVQEIEWSDRRLLKSNISKCNTVYGRYINRHYNYIIFVQQNYRK